MRAAGLSVVLLQDCSFRDARLGLAVSSEPSHRGAIPFGARQRGLAMARRRCGRTGVSLVGVGAQVNRRGYDKV